jgi:hypothetical protein
MNPDRSQGVNLAALRELAQNAALTHESHSGTPPLEAKQRVIGAAFFGFLVGGYAQNAADQTLPVIMGMVQKIDLEAAKTIYNDSSLYHTSVLIVANFLGAAVAGFLARRKGILAGVLSISLYILVGAYILIVSIGPQYSVLLSRLPLADDLAGDSSVQFQILLRLVLFSIAASLGGFIGHRLYAPEIDLDLGQPRVTIFGIRWLHYFWILPFIYLAFLASVLMIVYAGITVLWADLSFAWHPSLWFDFAWNWGFPVGPFLVWIATWITGASFVRFYEVMQHRQAEFRGWKKVGRVLLYGVGAPALSYTVAVLGADVARAMPKPAEGDWKIAVGIVAVILAIGAIASTISRILTKRRRWPESGISP